MEQTQQEQFIIRRIGGTTYKVRVAFSETAAETMEEKILRMIRNEGGYKRRHLWYNGSTTNEPSV